MDKSYVKTLIVMRQNEFPVPLYPRENPLPIDLGKIITVPGVRRCGKSSKMEMVVNRLIEDGVAKERILWIGFDDERLYNMTAGELDDIISAYRELYQEIDLRTVYMFFDEIQLISVGSNCQGRNDSCFYRVGSASETPLWGSTVMEESPFIKSIDS